MLTLPVTKIVALDEAASDDGMIPNTSVLFRITRSKEL